MTFKITARKLLITVGATVMVALGFWLFTQPPAPKVVMPTPNGFHDYLQAALALHRVDDLEGIRTNAVSLGAYLSDNREAMRFIRLGLTRESRVSYPLDKNYIQRRIQEKWWNIRKAGTLLEFEGRLAELEGRTNDAANAYLDFIRFSHEAYRGGPLIDAMIGFACEIQAIRPFAKLVPGLSANECRASIAILDQIESHREPVEDVLSNERIWSKHNASLRETFLVLIPSNEARQLRASRTAFVDNNLSRRRAMLRVEVELASRAFQLTNNRPPANVEELVPGLLRTLPTDPATHERLTLDKISVIKLDMHTMPPEF